MTPTNNQIKTAFYDLLSAANLGYPISWPGVDFTPPASGYWLEVMFFPNEGLDNGLRYADTVIPRGLFQVSSVTRPGKGSVGLGSVAEEIRATFPKGTQIVDMVRVIRQPWDMELEPQDDRMMIVVTVEYSG